jgi:hypothetical protein
MNPFEYSNAINYTKKNIMIDDITEKAYSSYMINRQLSYFPDTVLAANEMNRNHHLDNRLQFDFMAIAMKKPDRFYLYFPLIK